MSLRPQRTRRTKVYDCNYDIGQRYYKPVVDDLDRKYSGRVSAGGPSGGLGSLRAALDEAESSVGASARRVAREASADDVEDAVTSRRRPVSALMDDFDNIFENRGSRAAASERFERSERSARTALAALDGEEESTVSSRVRAARARAQAIEDEFSSSVSSSLASRKAKVGLDYSEKQVLDTVGLKNSDIARARQALADDSFSSSSSKRMLKVSVQPEGDSFTKWTKLSEADLGVGADNDFDAGAAAVRARKKAKARLAEIESELGSDFAAGAAADRARKSRARLADLEAEMEAVADRSAARDRRAAGLRALVAENEAAASEASAASSLRVRKVTSSVQSEKKTVTF